MLITNILLLTFVVGPAISIPVQDKHSDQSLTIILKDGSKTIPLTPSILIKEVQTQGDKASETRSRNGRFIRKTSFKTLISSNGGRSGNVNSGISSKSNSKGRGSLNKRPNFERRTTQNVNRSKSTDDQRSSRTGRKISSDRRLKFPPDLREFWLKLDQRKLNNKRKNVINKSDKIEVNSSNVSSSVNSTEVNPVFEDFPYLADDYDFSNYYYYDYPDEKISPADTTGKSEKKTVKKKEPVPEKNIIEPLSQNNTQEISSSNSNKNLIETRIKLQGRKASILTTEDSSTISKFVSAPPVTIPMTAEDSFLIKRQNNNRDPNKPRDILKEFPIFRQLKRNLSEPASFRKISLHERLRNRFTSSSTTTDSSINYKMLSTTENYTVIQVVHKTTQATKTTTHASPLTSIETTTRRLPSTITETTTQKLPSNSSETTILGIYSTSTDTTTQERPSTNTVATAEELPSTSTESTTQELPSTSTVATTTIQTSNETTFGGIQKEITFSTSKTHKVAESSSHIIDTTFKSQLGLAPEGETPFGVAPFGDTPMGESPFGVYPGGVAPHGNSSSDANDNISGDDGRYHVQVVSPDGSINGDYVVVDPVTGDLNGVRYEVAQDVDPLLVQRVLLNFLSLDPRLTPTVSDTTDPSTESIIEFILETTSLSESDTVATQTPSQLIPVTVELTRPPDTKLIIV